MDTKELVRKAKKRDADAFTELMQMHMKDMYRVAVAILMNDEDAADAIQDTILVCWEKLSLLKKEEYFKTWMTRVLIHKCYDIREKQKQVVTLEEWEEPSKEDAYNVEFKEALDQLKEKYRVIMILYYCLGYRIEEIAVMLELPQNTVKTRLSRGRKQLEDYYDDNAERRAIHG